MECVCLGALRSGSQTNLRQTYVQENGLGSSPSVKGRKQYCSAVIRNDSASHMGSSELDGPLKLFDLRQGDW